MNDKKSCNTKKVISTSGVSIIEVLVAFGLIAIVAAGIASLTTSGMKQQKGLQAKDQQREVTAEIRNLLNSKAACANSFGGPSNNPAGTGFTVNEIRDSSAAPGAVKYSVNTNDKTGLLRFEEFRVSNFVVDPTNASLGTAELQVRLSKVGDTGTVKDIRPDIIMLKVMRNIPGFIIECFSIGGKNEALWQISTNLSDIYYNGGNVGIGTSAPIMKLDITQGNIITSLNNSHNAVVNRTFTNGGHYSAYIGLRGRGTEASPAYPNIGDTLGGAVFRDAINGLGINNFGGAEVYGVAVENFSSTSKGTRLDFNTTPISANMPIRRMTISDNGNVGIGTATPSAKLEVTGEIKLGNTSTPCNAANEGQMRYNSTLKIMQFCNGTTWSVVGSSYSPLTCTNHTGFSMGSTCSAVTCPAGKFITQLFFSSVGPGTSCTIRCCFP